jgi:tetratricopeptide (TPR) repeat protein
MDVGLYSDPAFDVRPRTPTAGLRVGMAVLGIVAGAGVFLGQTVVPAWQTGEAPAEQVRQRRSALNLRDPLAARALDVFARVSAAADKRAGRPPSLLLLASSALIAQTLPDGTVALSRGSLELCFGHPPLPREAGDARLAYVLGHELAHLANNDFWRDEMAVRVEGPLPVSGMAATAVPRSEAGFTAHGQVQAASPTAITRDALADRRQAELRADTDAFVTMATAGFDPGVLLHEGPAFFEQWVKGGEPAAQTMLAGASDHPTPAQRAAAIRAAAERVVGTLDLFRAGVLLFETGRYVDAADLLERFRASFPSREVLNDLGVCHFHLAMAALNRCNPEIGTRFLLPMVFDLRTRAEKGATRGGPSDCRRGQVFQEQIGVAIAAFQEATERDALYLPAFLNLGTAQMMAGRPDAALAAAGRALDLEPGSVAALSFRAIALFELLSAEGMDTGAATLKMLADAGRACPQCPDVTYNSAAVLNATGRSAEGKSLWRRFLDDVPNGPFAEAARRQLGLPKPETPGAQSPRPATVQAPPALGQPTARLDPAAWSVAEERVLSQSEQRGRISVVTSKDGSSRVVAVDGIVVVLATPAPSKLDRRGATARFGQPELIVTTSSGETLVYRGFAVELRAGDSVGLIYSVEPVSGRP